MVIHTRLRKEYPEMQTTVKDVTGMGEFEALWKYPLMWGVQPWSDLKSLFWEASRQLGVADPIRCLEIALPAADNPVYRTLGTKIDYKGTLGQSEVDSDTQVADPVLERLDACLHYGLNQLADIDDPRNNNVFGNLTESQKVYTRWARQVVKAIAVHPCLGRTDRKWITLFDISKGGQMSNLTIRIYPKKDGETKDTCEPLERRYRKVMGWGSLIITAPLRMEGRNGPDPLLSGGNTTGTWDKESERELNEILDSFLSLYPTATGTDEVAGSIDTDKEIMELRDTIMDGYDYEGSIIGPKDQLRELIGDDLSPLYDPPLSASVEKRDSMKWGAGIDPGPGRTHGVRTKRAETRATQRQRKRLIREEKERVEKLAKGRKLPGPKNIPVTTGWSRKKAGKAGKGEPFGVYTLSANLGKVEIPRWRVPTHIAAVIDNMHRDSCLPIIYLK